MKCCIKDCRAERLPEHQKCRLHYLKQLYALWYSPAAKAEELADDENAWRSTDLDEFDSQD
jgi:hypothetical protein